MRHDFDQHHLFYEGGERINTAVYVIRLTVVAMAIGILLPLVSSGSAKAVIRLCGGILLTVIALTPLTGLSMPDISDWISPEITEGESVAAMGSDAAQTARDEVIIRQLSAYILDKAATLGLEVTAELKLDHRGIPESVQIQGEIPDALRSRLSAILEQELGIPKEKQEWILHN